MFNVLNIGFTVCMFALPSVALAYWYFYIHTPNKAAVVPAVIQSRPAEKLAAPPDARLDPLPPPKSIFFDDSTPSRSPRDVTPAAQPTPSPAAREQKELRRWSDASGKFAIEARFYSAVGEKVKLQMADERTIEVEIERLSEEDKAYLRALFKSKGIQASF